jgi:alpha-tubulin suppressor-like RCC1 family protein
VYCWGSNQKKQLAINDNNTNFLPIPRRVFPAGQNASELAITGLAAGDHFTHVAISHSVATWGTSIVADGNGLGHGAANAGSHIKATPSQLPAGHKPWGTTALTGVAGGTAMSAFSTANNVYVAGCAVEMVNGEPSCVDGLSWGDTNHNDRAADMTLNGNAFAAADLSMGGSYLCARQQGNGNTPVYCLGSNAPEVAFHEDGDSADSLWHGTYRHLDQGGQLEADASNVSAKNISGGKSLNCFDDGNVHCRGDGPNENDTMNMMVRQIPNAFFPLRDLAVGDGVGCLVGANGCVRCWGSNHEAQRGNGNRNQFNFDVSTPVTEFCGQNPDLGGGLVTNVAVGTTHVCVSTANGVNVWCWGNSEQGQAGFQAQNIMRCMCPIEVNFNGNASNCPQDCRNSD